MKVRESFPQGVYIFLFPPSLDELKNRIINRGTESEDLIRNRLLEAKKEIDMMDAYDYVVVNDEIENAVHRIQSIVISEHCKRERVSKQYKKALGSEA